MIYTRSTSGTFYRCLVTVHVFYNNCFMFIHCLCGIDSRDKEYKCKRCRPCFSNFRRLPRRMISKKSIDETNEFYSERARVHRQSPIRPIKFQNKMCKLKHCWQRIVSCTVFTHSSLVFIYLFLFFCRSLPYAV